MMTMMIEDKLFLIPSREGARKQVRWEGCVLYACEITHPCSRTVSTPPLERGFNCITLSFQFHLF